MCVPMLVYPDTVLLIFIVADSFVKTQVKLVQNGSFEKFRVSRNSVRYR